MEFIFCKICPQKPTSQIWKANPINKSSLPLPEEFFCFLKVIINGYKTIFQLKLPLFNKTSQLDILSQYNLYIHLWQKYIWMARQKNWRRLGPSSIRRDKGIYRCEQREEESLFHAELKTCETKRVGMVTSKQSILKVYQSYSICQRGNTISK